jgi:hypothetical protein
MWLALLACLIVAPQQGYDERGIISNRPNGPAFLLNTMSATDVSDTLQVALQASGLNQVKVLHRPRLLSDNGSSYVSSELGDWLEDHGISHIRGRPYHPMTCCQCALQPTALAAWECPCDLTDEC